LRGGVAASVWIKRFGLVLSQSKRVRALDYEGLGGYCERLAAHETHRQHQAGTAQIPCDRGQTWMGRYEDLELPQSARQHRREPRAPSAL
jgi:hypothetical protein